MMQDKQPQSSLCFLVPIPLKVGKAEVDVKNHNVVILDTPAITTL